MDWCSDHGCEYVRIGGPIELRPHYHILLITGSHSLSTRDTVGTFTMAEALTSQKLFTCKCAVASRIFFAFFWQQSTCRGICNRRKLPIVVHNASKRARCLHAELRLVVAYYRNLNLQQKCGLRKQHRWQTWPDCATCWRCCKKAVEHYAFVSFLFLNWTRSKWHLSYEQLDDMRLYPTIHWNGNYILCWLSCRYCKYLPGIHKHYSVEEWSEWSATHADILPFVAVSSGTSDADFAKVNNIMDAVNVPFICLDVANGYSEHVRTVHTVAFSVNGRATAASVASQRCVLL